MQKNKWVAGMCLGGMVIFVLVPWGYASDGITTAPTGSVEPAVTDGTPDTTLPQAMVIANMVLNPGATCCAPKPTQATPLPFWAPQQCTPPPLVGIPVDSNGNPISLPPPPPYSPPAPAPPVEGEEGVPPPPSDPPKPLPTINDILKGVPFPPKLVPTPATGSPTAPPPMPIPPAPGGVTPPLDIA